MTAVDCLPVQLPVVVWDDWIHWLSSGVNCIEVSTFVHPGLDAARHGVFQEWLFDWLSIVVTDGHLILNVVVRCILGRWWHLLLMHLRVGILENSPALMGCHFSLHKILVWPIHLDLICVHWGLVILIDFGRVAPSITEQPVTRRASLSWSEMLLELVSNCSLKVFVIN